MGPYYLKSNMSHSDYFDALVDGNQNNSHVNFSIITNVRGVTKTVSVIKQSLRVRDVKKFWLTKFKGVSFGPYEIPANKRLGFNTNAINQIDSELSSNGCDSNDSSDSSDSSGSSSSNNDTVSNTTTTSNTTTNNHNVYDFFENRKKKYSNLFIATTNSNVNNISLSGPSTSTSSININSISSSNDVSNNDYDIAV